MSTCNFHQFYLISDKVAQHPADKVLKNTRKAKSLAYKIFVKSIDVAEDKWDNTSLDKAFAKFYATAKKADHSMCKAGTFLTLRQGLQHY